MQRTKFILVLVCVAAICGCSVEHPLSREQVKEQAQEKKTASANANLGATPVPTPGIDDAQLVITACGRAASDQILAVYNKMDNGPVRRLVYRARQVVALDFVPSVPIARGSSHVAPTAPPNTVWRFDEARVEKEELLTADHIGVYLPCAAKALQKEY